MKWLSVKNNQAFSLDQIPFYENHVFHGIINDLLQTGCRMIALTPANKKKPESLIAIFANDESSSIYIVGGKFNPDNLQFESWANNFPQTNYFECELSENYGYTPINHPWIRPVRKQSVVSGNKKYEFFKLQGEEVHEVAVGPIHAGVIEPGHFRFQCHGELVYNLEINLGYQHRGVEKLIVDAPKNSRINIAESIAGDTTIGHTLAHCAGVEGLMKLHPTLRTEIIRSIALELERIAMHISGLGGLANDIGFALPAAVYAKLRTIVINSLAELCGSRFGRGLLIYGGVRYDISDEKLLSISSTIRYLQSAIKKNNEYLFSSSGVFSRFEGTGMLSTELAKSIGIVGLAARASGIPQDIRTSFPFSAYLYNPLPVITMKSGDVFARAEMRVIEINESIKFILEQLENLPKGSVQQSLNEHSVNSGVVSLVEGWRGEIVHALFTDANGDIATYKIKDPSFNNWYGLSLVLRETLISDFPLCNKSFDLSYCGHDL